MLGSVFRYGCAAMRRAFLVAVMNTIQKRPQLLIALISAIWPLILPLAFYLRVSEEIERGPVLSSTGLSHIGHRALIVVLALTFLLSLLTCWCLSRRPSASVGGRVVADLILVAAFTVTPWFVAVAIAGNVRSGPLEMWIPPGVLQRSIPCISAALAGLSFVQLRRMASSSSRSEV